MAIRLRNLVGGQWVQPGDRQRREIVNPADGQTVVAELAYSTTDDVATAVTAASKAFANWRATPIVRRCRILFHAKELLEQRIRQIAELLVAENGKTLAEAEGEVRRGIEVVEFAAGMPSLSKGDFIEDIATRVDGYIYREPVGVVVGACPFNFPAMIPMWMFPIAIACGNTFVLKPSEKCPATATLLAELFTEAGLPPGVLNVVHGARETFEALIAAEPVAAMSFVGSTAAAENVWNKAAACHKRVQALGGAKNYIVVMPDANPDATVEAVIGSSYGCAGQRCMASSVLVLVGPAEAMLDLVINAAKALKLGSGMDPSTTMGPLVSAQQKQRVEQYIDVGLAEGARLVRDGRGVNVEGGTRGFFVGPTIFDDVNPTMRIAREEIFGPVLVVMRARDLDEALLLVNSSPYGNGASIFTASGGAAREFRNRVECGMIGVNAGVPAPMAFFSFGGHKDSIFGDLRAHGPDAVEFYTKKKAVIERWFELGTPGTIWGK
jgi:malonate-semialdehyde dehydrogenase (acetylating)/methylmalonate-semialdehyde dehydrogenase